MILTVTLNPSLDRTVEIERLARGEVIRATSARLDPGGKGVNVSRALLANGVPSRAVLPCGGDEGAQLVRLLAAEGVDVLVVPVAGRTRSNLTLAEPDGTVTKINEPGPALSATELETLTAEILRQAVTADWVVVSGSTPPSLTDEAFGQLCRRLVAAGPRLAVDTSGSALRVAAGAGAALVKPNRDELAEVVGRRLDSLGDVVDAARTLRAWGAGSVLASLGADGAVLVDATGVVAGHCPVDRPRSAVGAGDALLAGFLAAETAAATGVAGTTSAETAAATGVAGTTSAETAAATGTGTTRSEALAEGLAWGAAAVSLPGSRMPGPADLPRQAVRLHSRPDRIRPLPTPG